MFLESMNRVGVPSAGGVGGACCDCPGLSFISTQLISCPLARVCIIDRPRPTASHSDLTLHIVVGRFRSYLSLSLFQFSCRLSSSTCVSFPFSLRDGASRLGCGIGCLRLGLLLLPAWAVGTCINGKQARGSFQN